MSSAISKIAKALLVAYVLLSISGCMPGKRLSRSSSDGYDVYLLIGQSNMAGRGEMILPQDTLNVLEGVWLLGPEDTPVPATNPLNQYSTIRKGMQLQQIGPGNGFSESMYGYNGRQILLVVNARGGSRLNEWEEGTFFYNEAVRRGKAAMKYGKLRGILWHQGCSDSTGGTDNYLQRLAAMVNALRRDLEVGNEIPFVAGELAYWRSSSHVFNEMIHNIADAIPNSGWVSADGCGPLKPEILGTNHPDPHFSRDGQLLLGKRYAEELTRLHRSR